LDERHEKARHERDQQRRHEREIRREDRERETAWELLEKDEKQKERDEDFQAKKGSHSRLISPQVGGRVPRGDGCSFHTGSVAVTFVTVDVRSIAPPALERSGHVSTMAE
jgi:hypothetical protein